VKAWLQAVTTLRSLPTRTFSCEPRRCFAEADADADADAGANFTRRVVDDEYVYARVADPLGYARPYDVIADAGFAPKGRRVLDFGYGNAGQLVMLASLGAHVTGVEVDPLLPLALAPLSGAVPGGGSLRVLDGFFPADAALTSALGRGYDLFIAKNTLKRGYIHPEQPVPARQRIDLGVSDVAFVKAVASLLKPGGLFFIYNLSPAQAPPGQPYKPMADGRCPFSKADLEAGGFEVLAWDQVDDAAARRMGVALGWDQDPESPWDLEHDLFAHYTLAKKR
jgi:SAM-dependent methyltransferase